jgi:hypothetical protein
MKAILLLLATCCALSPQQSATAPVVFTPIDLERYANRKLTDNQGSGVDGNDLASVPRGEREFAGIKFRVGAGLIQLGSTGLSQLPERVDNIAVGQPFTALHILHATIFGGGPNKRGSDLFVADGTRIGEYRVNFEDGTAVVFPIVYGKDVRDWFYAEGEAEPARGKVAWAGENVRAKQVGAAGIRLYRSQWTNPWPEKKATTIEYASRKDETVAAPFCVAVTIEQR